MQFSRFNCNNKGTKGLKESEAEKGQNQKSQSKYANKFKEVRQKIQSPKCFKVYRVQNTEA